jgi:isochorismate synthase
MQLNKTQRTGLLHALNECNDPFFYYSFPLDFDFNCLETAASSSVHPCIYFSKPQQRQEYLSFGAWRIGSSHELNAVIKQSREKSLRLFGINAFSKMSKSPLQYWVLPIIWFDKNKSQTMVHVVIDLEAQSKEDGLLKLNQILEAINPNQSSLMNQVYLNQSHNPTKDQWVDMVKRAKHCIQKNDIQKVVLARQSTFEFKNNVNPFLLLKKVQKKDGGVYNFCIQVSPNYSFIGGTPERLFEIKNGVIESDAIAGTLFKSGDEHVEALKKALLTSDKNIGEHQYVVDFLTDKLSLICSSIDVDEQRSLIELKYLLHLIMHFRGPLNPNEDWLTAIDALHPTPAVGGVPSVASLSFIDNHEPFDRGWYAGPMGTVTKDEAHIVVAIRSGDVIGNRVVLAAGAGIVEESDPASEWNELNAKINLFTRIFKENA